MDKLLVIKCGGSFVAEKKILTPFLQKIKELKHSGFSLVIIHGGGPQADELAGRLKIPTKKVNGRRITDLETLQITKMTYAGLINTDLIAACISNNIQAIGISGVSSKLVEVVKRPKKLGIDFGYVGDIKKINKKLLELLLKNNYVPVISSLGVDVSGQVFNINADGLAAHIASSLQARQLIFISDVQGVAKDKEHGEFLQYLSLDKAQELISQGVITGGMIPKIESSLMALKNGVRSVKILGPLKTKVDWGNAILDDKFGTIVKLSRPHSS